MFMRKFSKFFSLCIVLALFFSLSFTALFPSRVDAAIIATGPNELIPSGGMHLPASGFDSPILKFSLTQSAGETLSSVALTITNNASSTVTNNALADHIDFLAVYRDTNGNNFFDPQSDLLAGTQSIVKVATSTTVISTGSNNTIASTGGLPTTFFVTVKTDSTWIAPDAFKVNMAANGIVTSANSPTVTALTGLNAVDAQTQSGGGMGGFGVQKVIFVSSKVVDVIFTDLLDLNAGQTTSTANYTFTGTGAASVTSVIVLPDNKTVRVIAADSAALVGTGGSHITVSTNVKNHQGIPNSSSATMPLFDGFQPLVISEIKVGTATDPFDEFIEIYNRSGGAVPTSTMKLHFVNVDGTVDVNVPLTFLNFVTNTPANGFFLIAPVTSPASTTADAVYTTSSIRSLVPNGGAYLSTNVASSTGVLDRVCWGSHTPTTDCEGAAAPSIGNNGTSLERKANNSSTPATMEGGSDAANGNGTDTQNNVFDFVVRGTPQPQSTGIPTGQSALFSETPGGGFWGAGNQAPKIQHVSVFSATTNTLFSVIARMTDDGGDLTPSKTQLILCTTSAATCTPASSTPIFGTSIGAGWFKFSSTSTTWGLNRTLLKYYLQATDSAPTPKTQVFTNDPSFDTVTFDTTSNGIQSGTLQQSKSLGVTLSSGNLGSASLIGSVKDSSSVGIGGATVWLEGTQFAATTANDGSFSFANVGPSGGKQLRVAKDGYGDQVSSIFVPPSGFVNLPVTTLFGGTVGSGGDFSQPKVINSNPPMNATGFPTQGPGGGAPSIILNFNKAMSTSTILIDNSNNNTTAAATIYLTEAGSQTKISSTVTIASNQTQVTITPAAALTVGKGYTLFVTPGAKDTAGNPVSGNGGGGQFVLMFSTTGQFFSNFSEIGGGGSTFGQGSAFPPFVKGSMPAPGAQNIALNAKFFITFSEAMQDTSVNKSKVVLYSVSSPFTSNETKSEIATTNSFDTTGKILILTPTVNLGSKGHYRIEVLGGITSSKGVPLGNPGATGFSSNSAYKTDFDVGSSTDTTAPVVVGTIPSASATGASTVNPIVINFSEVMDPSTISDSTISVKLGSSAVDGTLTYDPMAWTAKFVPTYSLTALSNYTITITTGVKDLAGNALAAESLRTFTTGNADSTQPVLMSAQGNDFALKINFSKPMLSVPTSDLNGASSVLTKENYTLHIVNSVGAVQGSALLLTGATLSYDAPMKSVTITGLPSIGGFSAGSTLIRVTVTSTKDIGFNTIANGFNVATSTAQSSSMGGGFFGGGGPVQDGSGNIIQGGGFGPPPTEMSSFKGGGFNIGFIPSAKAFPFNSMAGVSTNYAIEVPISTQIPAGGKVCVTFPEGTDVTNAKKDAMSPKNNDINGPGTGTVVFATSEGTLPSGWVTGGQSSDGVIVNISSYSVCAILGAVATRSEGGDTHDFVNLDLAQIVNSSIVTGIGTSGNAASIETRKGDDTVLENFTSGSFFTTQGGNYTVRGRVLAGATGLDGVNVFLMSPMTGPQSTTTATGRFNAQAGEFLFQTLVTSSYMLGIDQYFKVGATNYTSGVPIPVNVNNTTCPTTICSNNISVADASTGATVTISISGTFSNDAVDIFASGPNGFRIVTTTLNGTLTNNTANSIKLNANGSWFVGFGPAMQGGMFSQSGPTNPPGWIIPKPKQVIVSGCPGACAVSPGTVAFNVSTADKTVKFIVKDQTTSKIGQAHVSAYSPGLGVGNDTIVNADGTGSLKLSYGTFKVSANVSGMLPGAERSILVKSDGGADKVFIDGSSTGIALSSMANTDLVLTISKPSYTISGKVTDGTNAISNAPVFGFRTDGQGHTQTFTNSSGEYSLYVNNGIWKIGVMLPEHGRLEKTVTISGASASNQNFEPDTSSVTYASLTKSVIFDTNGDGVYVVADDQEVNNATVIIRGTTGDFNNDGDTSDTGEGTVFINTIITDTNGSSTFKLPPGTFTMEAWSPTYGNISSSSIATTIVVNSAGTITQQPADILAQVPGTVTINLLDVNGNATTTNKVVVEFVHIGGTSNNISEFGGTASTTVLLPTFDVGADSVTTGAITNTSPANFYLMSVVIPGVSQSDMSVYGASGTIMATSSATTGLWKVEVDGSESINIRLPDLNTISGTVTDASGNAVPDAKVILRDSNNETVEVTADTNGYYATKVSDGTYQVYASKDGYIDTATTVTITTTTAMSAASTKVTATTIAITGTITTNGSAVADATVRAEKLGGGMVMATTGSDGTYTVLVTSGDWKISAVADGYAEKAHGSVVTISSSDKSGINVDLTTTNTALAGTTSLSLTPQTGGQLNDTIANINIKAPGSSLSNSTDSILLSSKEISNVVSLGTGMPIGSEGKEIRSITNDGETITTLNDDVGVSGSYTTSELTTSLGTLTIAKIEAVHMSSIDETTDNWENLPTTISYKNSSGNYVEPNSTLSNVSSVSFTGQTVHLSVFNATQPSDGLAPATPSGIAVSGSNGSVTISWSAVTTNSDGSTISDLLGYEIYRATSEGSPFTQINTSDITGTSYTDSGLSNGTTYYYKVTAADTGGLESSMTGAYSGLPTAAQSGSGGGTNFPSSGTPATSGVGKDTKKEVKKETTESKIKTAPTTSVQETFTVGSPTSISVDGSSHIVTVTNVYTKTKKIRVTIASKIVKLTLKLGQTKMADTNGDGKKDLKVKYVALKDEKPVLQFTPIKIKAKKVSSPASSTSSAQSKATPTKFIFISDLKAGGNGNEVKQLQIKLKALGFFPATVEPNGNYGPVTVEAVKKFQKAKGVEALGIVGKATRDVLNKL